MSCLNKSILVILYKNAVISTTYNFTRLYTLTRFQPPMLIQSLLTLKINYPLYFTKFLGYYFDENDFLKHFLLLYKTLKKQCESRLVKGNCLSANPV